MCWWFIKRWTTHTTPSGFTHAEYLDHVHTIIPSSSGWLLINQNSWQQQWSEQPSCAVCHHLTSNVLGVCAAPPQASTMPTAVQYIIRTTSFKPCLPSIMPKNTSAPCTELYCLSLQSAPIIALHSVACRRISIWTCSSVSSFFLHLNEVRLNNTQQIAPNWCWKAPENTRIPLINRIKYESFLSGGHIKPAVVSKRCNATSPLCQRSDVTGLQSIFFYRFYGGHPPHMAFM
jgi:hypothetical protein